jgi:predicted GIY-YIG superfamily endonuclease
VSITPRKPPRLADQRKTLPDGPGVYLFRDAKGKVIYVGKAKSIKKRVASHFSNPVTRGSVEMADVIAQIEFLLVASETEALLAEQNFIKQYKPRFNIRLRDDKSYPFIAISMDEEFPRVYFTRERHRRDRCTSARTRAPSGCAPRSRCSARSSSTAPVRRPSPAGAAARRAWTTTSSAAGRPASAT